MKSLRSLLTGARRHQGLALIIVLSMLALATIVILAFMSVADTENKASNIYSASQSSRRFADTAVNMVIAQIRSGSERDDNGVPVIHATQPGAVRKYNVAGDFVGGYKLFSDRDMVFRATAGNANAQEEQFVRESEPPSDWNTGNNVARYVNMNEPVVKGAANDASGNGWTSVVYFPIMDPRAGQNVNPLTGGDKVPVEGFSYETSTALTGNNLAQNTDSGVAILKPSDGTAAEGENGMDQLRLAMPVQWLYMLKDGAVGYLDEQSLEFTLLSTLNGPALTNGDSYGTPSESNPIVSRIAFWTDDETSKININTASEPTYAGQPIYYHERDHRWADFPPARAEYQRYPGHPATVALSSVFFPNPLQDRSRSLDTYSPTGPESGANLSRATSVKERIYSLMPRIHTGGSYAGTRTFENDDYDSGFGEKTTSSAVAIREALGERLYASVDELMFSQGAQGGRRALNEASVNSNIMLFNKSTLERTSAFLTAHSRASEINLFGLPRVAMWPLPATSNKRTGFDNLIEFASRLGNATSGNSYIFQREHSRSIPSAGINASTYDIELPRNVMLLDMLDKILSQPFPTATSGGSGNTARSFKQKLGESNARQVLVSMFDYIRSINVYDSYLVPPRNEWPSRSVDWTQFYILRDNTAQNMKTFTPGPVVPTPSDRFADRMLPAHGQVTPSTTMKGKIAWRSPDGAPLKGFGRFLSISEIGFQFICTADGQPDMYSWRLPLPDTSPAPSGMSAEERARRYALPDIPPSGFEANAQGAIPLISGGRTALRIDETVNDGSRVISHSMARGFDRGNQGNAWITNTQAMHWQYNPGGKVAEGMVKDRFYSNFPPLRNPTAAGFYGTTATPGQMGGPSYSRFYQYHPGYNPDNWNWTLDYDTPLGINQKRVQALLHLEFFCPSVGYTELFPDYTIVLAQGSLPNIEVNGNTVFSTTSAVGLKSQKPMWEIDSHPEVGGFAAFRNIALDRPVGSRGTTPEDAGYETGAVGQVHRGLVNMELVSSYFNVNRNDTLSFKTKSPLRIMIFDHHVEPSAAKESEAIQVIEFSLPEGQAPAPDLVTYGTYLIDYTRSDGSRYMHPVVQAPRWWGFNKDGVVGRQLNNNIAAAPNTQRGRFYLAAVSNTAASRANDPRIGGFPTFGQSVPGARSLIWGRDGANFYDVRLQARDILAGNPLVRIGYGPASGPYSATGVDLSRGNADWDTPFHFGSDTIRTIQPAHGDARLIAAKRLVKESDWTPHRFWNDPNEYMAHNFSAYHSGSEPGFDRGVTGTSTTTNLEIRGLPKNVTVDVSRWPDIPSGKSSYSSLPLSASEYMQRYYDFDDSDPGGRVGPFINKVDEGNYAIGNFVVGGWTRQPKWRTTYFRTSSTSTRFADGNGSFFTPNRMVPSPVIMGSLPSRLWDNNSDGAWTNLLFRPYVQYQSGVTGGYSSPANHPGEASPPDHYLLDLFWMPIVEPYALSESFSTAGKVNLNYQMLPFTHIRRATAVHAAMKGEIMAAIPNAEYENSKGVLRQWGANGSTVPTFRQESDNFYWHRAIVADRFGPDSSVWWRQQVNERVQGTLLQFEERFNFVKSGGLSDFKGGLFRTTSQLCELHLIPGRGKTQDISPASVSNYNSRKDAMARFWSEHCSTGDNTRERPYSYLYNKFTTRSNTFRVHVRAQSIRKASRSVAHDKFDPTQDKVAGEFRGSFLIERYLDQADMQRAGANVDYAAAGNPFALKPLESYYRFRVIESKRFAP